jgi:hypothetical protein
VREVESVAQCITRHEMKDHVVTFDVDVTQVVLGGEPIAIFESRIH